MKLSETHRTLIIGTLNESLIVYFDRATIIRKDGVQYSVSAVSNHNLIGAIMFCHMGRINGDIQNATQ